MADVNLAAQPSISRGRWNAVRRLFAFVLVLGFTVAAWALDPSRSLTQYRAQSWSRQNGLTVSSVKAITQTKDGYLWLGTQQGLVRFDGSEFTAYPVVRDAMFLTQNISALASSAKGGLWFGLKEGAAGYFDGTHFAPVPAPWLEPNMHVYGLHEARDGSLWVTWNFGFAHAGLQSGAKDAYSVGKTAYLGLYEDAQGRTWVAAAEPGVIYRWDHGEREQLRDDTLADCYIQAIAVDAEHRAWVGTQHGLRCYDGDFRPLAIPAWPSTAQVNCLLVDRHGALWIGTEGDGLYRYSGGKFSRFAAIDGLGNDYVSSLYEDTEGNLWVGTRSGLTQLSDVKFPLFGEHEGVSGEPLGVATARDGALLIATASGLERLDNSGAKPIAVDVPFPNRYLKRVWQARNGDVYVIDGNRGLDILRDGRLLRRYELKEWPIAFAEDAQGVLVSFGPEIYRVSAQTAEPLQYKDPVPPMVWVVNLCVAHDGTLWAATHRGIWRIKDGHYRQWSTHNGLSGTVANWIFEDSDGTIWAGLASGVARIRGDDVKCLNRGNGLFDNFIYAIVPDQFGWFWMDSSAGIFRVRRQNLEDVANGRAPRLQCEAFDGQDAVKSNDKHAQEPTAGQTPDGRIWFPTALGVVAVDPKHIPRDTMPPPVYVQEVRVNGERAAATGDVVGSVGRGDLELHYTALSFAAPEKIRFRYRLEGYDETWTEAQDRRSAFYTNLKPGRYVFRVQACNADGVWNTAGDSLAVMLPPHFYQTSWFIGLAVAAGISLLGGAYLSRVSVLRRRQRKLQEMNALLDAKVQSRTDELARANRQLTDEIAERKRLAHEADETHQQLLLASREAGMAEVATSVLHNVGNVLNSVNVSTSVMITLLREAKFEPLAKIADLLATNADTPGFLANDEKGRKVAPYLGRLAQHLTEQHASLLREVTSLRKNIEHIKDIVQMQQSYSRLQATVEKVSAEELVTDAVRLSGAGLPHRHCRVVSDVAPGASLTTDKSKVLQVLVNLLRNALQACAAAGTPDCAVHIRVTQPGADRLRFEVADTGVGIASEHMGKLFTQGFTTRKEGHGYGLHSSAIAAKALGGTLNAHSDGPGRGATFTLELPIDYFGVAR